MFKMVRSLHDKVLAPSLNFRDPNPNVDWDRSPFRVNTELREWPAPPCGVRRGGVSAFGFGGTNFHVVLEEHVPGRHKPAGAASPRPTTGSATPRRPCLVAAAGPVQGAAARCAGARRPRRCRHGRAAPAVAGRGPRRARPGDRRRPTRRSARRAVRVAVDFADAADLAAKLDKLAQGLCRRPTRRRSACCASRARSSAAARRRRWPSSTPARARSTSTCCASCASASPSWRRPSRVPTR